MKLPKNENQNSYVYILIYMRCVYIYVYFRIFCKYTGVDSWSFPKKGMFLKERHVSHSLNSEYTP